MIDATAPVVVVDLETTGTDYRLDRILEIGAVRLEGGREVAVFSQLVDPEVQLRPENVAVHGITPAMVEGAPRLGAVLPAFLEFLGDAPLVAHSALFDYNFLDHWSDRTLGVRLRNPMVDTQVLAKEVFPGERNPSLDRLRALLGHPPVEQLHRALPDARGLAEVLPRLLELRDQRLAWHRAQFDRVDHLAARYEHLQALVAQLQREASEVRRTLELYLAEAGGGEGDRPVLTTPSGTRVWLDRRESWEYHPEVLTAALESLGIKDQVLKPDRSRLDRWLKGDRLDEAQRALLLEARRFAGHVERLVLEPASRPTPTPDAPGGPHGRD